MTAKTGLILVDSNILVYAINRSSPKHRSAQKFLNQNRDRLVATHQNILETLRVLTHSKFPVPMSTDRAIEAVTAITDACRLVNPSQTASQLALMLVKKHALAGDNVFDAYLAATTMTNDVNTIATDNVKDFRVFEGLEVINPFA